jgi:hypothetical protein
MFAAGPRIVLAKGEYWNALACRWSKTTSSGCFSTCSIKTIYKNMELKDAV